MATITDDLFKKIAPTLSPALRKENIKWLNKYCYEFEIDTELELAAFFANFMEESGYFTRMEENLNYSAGRLMKIWPRRFPTLEIANKYAHHPQELANYVYGGRNGNRPGTNDGWVYRGGGYGQTTGRDNFKITGEHMGLDLVSHPELLRNVENAVKSACVEWKRRGCNKLADNRQLDLTRRAINGGTNGIENVRINYNNCMRWLPDGFTLSKPSKLVLPTLMTSPGKYEVPDSAFAVDAGSPAWVPEEEQQTPVGVSAAASAEPTSEAQPSVGPDTASTLGTAPTPKERIAIAKPEKKGFITRMWLKVSSGAAINVTFKWVQDQLEPIRALGLSSNFWLWVGIIIVVSTVIWLLHEFIKDWKAQKRDEKITELLITENSTPNNNVQLIEHDEAELYRMRGFKIITR